MKRRPLLPSLVVGFALSAAPWMPSAAQNPPKDIRSLTALAERGDAAAQNSLGFRYEHGMGVTKDRDAAVKWYTKAGDQGNGAAQNNLCKTYNTAAHIWDATPGNPLAPVDGKRSDLVGAQKWCERGGQQGYVDSQDILGNLYAKGSKDGTVAPDYEQAYFWLTLSGQEKDLANGVKKKLTPEQVKAQDAKIKKWNDDFLTKPRGP